MNKYIFVLLLLFTNFANAKYFVGADYYTIANGDNEWWNNLQSGASYIVNYVGYDFAQLDMMTKLNYGIRAGMEFNIKGKENSLFGFSVGYVKGPSAEIKLDAYDSSYGPGYYREDIKTSFFTFLPYLRQNFMLNDKTKSKFSFLLGCGLAKGHIESENYYSGSFVSYMGMPGGTYKLEDDWVGFAFEFSPSFIFPAGENELEMGARFSYFPELDDDNFSKFKWTPLGLFLRFNFR